MSAPATTPRSDFRIFDPESRHKIRWSAVAFLAISFLAALGVEGYSFYSLPLPERVHHEAYDQFRPSGSIGINLGLLGGVLFMLIYLYPIRKRWPWLRKKGNTKHWLDFHVLFGLVAPMVITFHSTFKFHGIAGMAFWIMWAVATSGLIGRYFYSRIPRRITAAELSLAEIEEERSQTAALLAKQDMFEPAELEEAMRLPSHAAVQAMPLGRALLTMIVLDIARPFRVSRLRRRSMSFAMQVLSLGGLLPLGNRALEVVIRSVRRQVRLSTKMRFLSKTQRLFHLWHVVHRPFSYSFSILVLVHVAFVVYLGYFWG
jgi:hypothetical protein